VKVPIPSDWDGKTWECIQIQWPDSPEWLTILAGLLTQATRGRLWEETTGTVTEAQAIGWAIHDRNYPLEPCLTASIINPPAGGIAEGGFGSSDDESEDEEMPVSYIKIVDGKLRVFYGGPCCYEDLAISALIAGEGTPDTEDPVNPDNDPDFVYSACGKATGIVNAVYLCIEATFDAVVLPLPWQVIPYIEDAVGYDLDNVWLYPLIANAGALLLASLSFEDVASEIAKQNAISAVAALFDDDNVGVPTSELFEDIKTAIKNAVGVLSPMYQMVDQAVNAIGRADMDTIARRSAGDTDAVCEGAQGGPDIFVDQSQGLTWSHVWDFRLATLPAGYSFDVGVNTQHAPGQGLWAWPQGSTDKCDVGIRFAVEDPNAVASITRSGIRVVLRGDEDFDFQNPLFISADSSALFGGSVLTGISGDNPAAAGTYELVRALGGAAVPVGSGEPDEIFVFVSAFHPPDTDKEAVITNSQVVVAIFLGGTGADPWPSVPQA